MARPRSARYRDLPDNLTFDTTRGVYRYRHPITKKRSYMSANKAECVRAAKRLNAMLMPASGDLVSRALGGGHTFTMAVYKYEADRVPLEEWSAKTRSQYVSYLKKLRACSLGPMAMADIQVVHVVAALDKITTGNRMRNVYRHLMGKVFAYAINLGWCAENPAEVTLRASEKRQRMRLTMDGYSAVYQSAAPWLRAAMDMALITLQRPEDLVIARYSDIEDGALKVCQQKTGTKLRIAIGDELAAVIRASRDAKVCPFIIHRKPDRTRSSKLKEHSMQVTVDYLGKAFAKARDASGFYSKAGTPPPFYEIKSLGGDRYRSMGWSEGQIQALYGHKDRDMTDHYLAGHEAPWEDVTAG